MSMQPLSPSKVLHGDGSLWTASLVIEVQISDGFPNHHLNRQGLKAKEGMLFQELDILAEQSYTDSRFYIFNPQKFAPSKVKEDLKAARKSLQDYLVHAGMFAGCKFTSHTLSGWGDKGKEQYQKFFYLKCSQSILKSPTIRTQGEGIKLASTNNTRKLHNTVNGNVGLARKTSTSKKTEKTELCNCQPLKVFNNEYCFFVTVPDCSRYHSNHQKEQSYKELSLGTSKMSSPMKKDRQTMGYATSSAASQARGMNRLFQVRPTKQSMANSSTKDTISARSKIDKSHLMQLNDAEGITKLLHEYGCRVLCLKMVTNKLDDHSSPVKPNSITYNISGNGKASSGEIDYGQEAVTEWVETTKSDLSNQQQDLICIAWTSKDMIKLARAFPQTLAIDALLFRFVVVHPLLRCEFFMLSTTVNSKQ